MPAKSMRDCRTLSAKKLIQEEESVENQEQGATLRDVTVGQILKAIKQQQVHSISPSSSVHHASSMMDSNNIGALVVLEGDKLVGIVSERDILRRCVVPLKNPKTTPIATIMTPDPETVSLLTLSTECEKKMQRLNARHLPVMGSGKVIGIISIRDILYVTRMDQKFLADQLFGYVRGG